MFREMRRKNQQLPYEECIKILENSTSGVLSVTGDNDYAYGVPLSYVFKDNKIYFHCALTGHKIDGINRNNKVSFCVISQDNVVPEEFTTHFVSVIVFGKARIVEDIDEKIHIARIMAEKYSPLESDKSVNDEIDRFIKVMGAVVIDIEHMTGKESKALAQQRKTK